MRRFLDGLYEAALGLAALTLAVIAALVTVQVAGRIIDRAALALGIDPPGIVVTSLAEIGGFLFVGAVFLALPGTFRAGGHVRVTMLARAISGSAARALTFVVLIAALGLALFALWSSGAQALDSWTYGAVSYGMIKIPLLIPQAAMTLGLFIFCIALLDEAITLLGGRNPAFLQAEDAREGPDGH
ncbi:TRAP-type C4-dicarboxylate transport system permease small subunit [Rhodobacteraceae bacterium MBR-64]